VRDKEMMGWPKRGSVQTGEGQPHVMLNQVSTDWIKDSAADTTMRVKAWEAGGRVVLGIREVDRHQLAPRAP